MNVEVINPAAVRQLLKDSDTNLPRPNHRPASNWAKRLRERLVEAARYQRALYQLRRLDERDLDFVHAPISPPSQTGTRAASSRRRGPADQGVAHGQQAWLSPEAPDAQRTG